jgi:F0F1-type ATP synthase assembly protein I
MKKRNIAPQKRISEENDYAVKRFWQVALSFGVTLGIFIYVLGFLIGAYCDEKLGTTPIFTIVGALLAIFTSFYRLFVDLKKMEEQDSTKKEH